MALLSTVCLPTSSPRAATRRAPARRPRLHGPGRVRQRSVREGYARHGEDAAPNSGGSQFFICYDIPGSAAALNGKYTVFGKVTAGMDVVEKLTPRDPQTNPNRPATRSLEMTVQEQ